MCHVWVLVDGLIEDVLTDLVVVEQLFKLTCVTTRGEDEG
jgi:hypothetical protein